MRLCVAVISEVMCGTHLPLIVAKADAEVRHGSEDGYERLNGITVHYRPVLFEVLWSEPTLVDNSATKWSCQSQNLYNYYSKGFWNVHFIYILPLTSLLITQGTSQNS